MISCRNKLLFILCLVGSIARAEIPVVHQSALKKISPDSYGLYVGQKTDAVNDSIWAGTDFDKALIAIKSIKPISATATKIQKNILLSTANEPTNTPANAFLTARLEKLFELGFFEEIIQLSKKMPFPQRTEQQNRIITDALVLTDFNAACVYPAENNEKIKMICAAIAGNEDETYRLMDIVKEQSSDIFVLSAAENILSKTPLTERPTEFTALNIQILKLVGANLTPTLQRSTLTWVHKALVDDPSIPLTLKIETAEKLTEKGLYKPEKLRELYDQTDMLNGDLKTAFEKAHKRKVASAFARATPDLFELEEIGTDNLKNADWIIEGLMLADLPKQASVWLEKADLIYPMSETVTNGWAIEELQPKTERFFIPRIETMIAANQSIEKIDTLMVIFQTLKVVGYDEPWRLTSIKEPTFPKYEMSVGEKIIHGLNLINSADFADFLTGLHLLQQTGLTDEAFKIILEKQRIPHE